MGKNSGSLDLSQVIAVPVLSETAKGDMWMGVVRSDDITPEMISDNEIRNEVISLTRKFEKAITRYRTQNVLVQTLTREEKDELREEILDLGDQITRALSKTTRINLDLTFYWVQLCREYEKILESNPEELKYLSKETKRNLERIRTGYASDDPNAKSVFNPETNSYECLIFPTINQEKKCIKNNGKNKEQLRELIKSIAGKENVTPEEEFEIMKELFGELTIVDFDSLFEYRSVQIFEYITFFRNFLLKNGYDKEKIEELSYEELAEIAFENYNEQAADFHAELMASTIKNSIDYIDLDKLLLLSSIRPLKTLELMKPQVDENEDTTLEPIEKLAEKVEKDDSLEEEFIVKLSTVEDVISICKRREYINKKIIESGIVSNKKRFKVEMSGKNEEISLAVLNQLMENFQDGIYLTEVLELNIKYKGYINEDEMSNWSDELICKMNFSDRDKYTLSLISFENLKRLYKLGIIDKEYIKFLLEDSKYQFDEPEVEFLEEDNPVDHANKTIKNNLRNLLKNLVESDMITEEEIREYFAEGFITKEMLETLEKEKSQEDVKKLNNRLKGIVTSETILNRYKDYIEKYLELIKLQKENPEMTDEIENLKQEVDELRNKKDEARELLLKYNSDLTEEDWKNFGNELLEKYYVEMEVSDEETLQESIKVLYEDGLIDLENIIQLDKDYIIPMLDTLSLEDAEKIKNNMSFEQLRELLDNIFMDSKFSDERKFIMVMNLLGDDTEEEKKVKESYLSLLDFDENSAKRATPSGNRRNGKGNGKEKTKNSSKEYIYSDTIKWRFFKAIDPDVRVVRYANGYVEFASNKLGCRIIEKYYDKNEPAYGTATYVMPEQVYRKNQINLVTATSSGMILEPATLKNITPRQDRIAHRTHSPDKTWMDEMVRYLEKNYGLVKDKKLEEFVRNNKTKWIER